MSFYIQINDLSGILPLSNTGLQKGYLDPELVPPEICHNKIKKEDIVQSSEDANFAIFLQEKNKILAIMTVAMYDTMWEIQHICSIQKGAGSKMINILKNLAMNVPYSVTLYGLGIHEGSRELYKRHNFYQNDDNYDKSYYFDVKKGGKTKKRKIRKRIKTAKRRRPGAMRKKGRCVKN
jgi:hypothetical protein